VPAVRFRVNAKVSPRYTAKEATMPLNSTRSNPAGFVSYVSDNRFLLLLLACSLAFALELVVVNGTVGFASTWASFAVPASP
jgi:hypothetical protein